MFKEEIFRKIWPIVDTEKWLSKSEFSNLWGQIYNNTDWQTALFRCLLWIYYGQKLHGIWYFYIFFLGKSCICRTSLTLFSHFFSFHHKKIGVKCVAFILDKKGLCYISLFSLLPFSFHHKHGLRTHDY